MREKQNKRARTGSFNFAQPKSEGGNRSQFLAESAVPALSLASSPAHKFRDGNRDRAPGSKSQGSVSNARTNPLCQTCGKNHKGTCRAGSDVYFECGKPGHRDCPQSGYQVIRVGKTVPQPSPVAQISRVPLPVLLVGNTQIDFMLSSTEKIRKILPMLLLVRYRSFICMFTLY